MEASSLSWIISATPPVKSTSASARFPPSSPAYDPLNLHNNHLAFFSNILQGSARTLYVGPTNALCGFRPRKTDKKQANYLSTVFWIQIGSVDVLASRIRIRILPSTIKSTKNVDFYNFVTSFWLLRFIYENWCKCTVTLKSNKQFANPEPYQNVTYPQHCLGISKKYRHGVKKDSGATWKRKILSLFVLQTWILISIFANPASIFILN